MGVRRRHGVHRGVRHRHQRPERDTRAIGLQVRPQGKGGHVTATSSSCAPARAQRLWISSLAFTAARLQTVVEECSKASKSADARDKYFLSYVGEADACPSKQLRSELPAFEAAKSALAATTSELVDVLPALATCSASGAELLQHRGVPPPLGNQLRSVQTSVARRSETGSGSVDDVEEQNGVDASSVKLLLEAARGAILLTRGL